MAFSFYFANIIQQWNQKFFTTATTNVLNSFMQTTLQIQIMNMSDTIELFLENMHFSSFLLTPIAANILSSRSYMKLLHLAYKIILLSNYLCSTSHDAIP